MLDVITGGPSNAQFLVGTAARAHWGRARLPVCQALLARARKLIDMHGLLRVPSVTGVQALSLYSQLQHMSDTQDNLLETEMESTYADDS